MPVTNPYYLNAKYLERRTLTASGTISKCRLVGYAGAQLSAAGALAFGVAVSDSSAGKQFTVTTEGSEVVESGAAIASVGTALASDAQGRVVPAATGNQIIGRALSTASAAGQFIEIYITREGVSA